MRGGGPSFAGATFLSARYVEELQIVATEVEAGRLKDVDEVQKAVQQGMERAMEKLQKESGPR